MTGDFTFPKGFLWGAATAAYQVEGSPLADGAGPSIWHRFSHTPGTMANGDTGDVACDQYRRWPEDVALMRSLGLQAYRFSVAWGRVMPEGRGAVNPRGLDHYERLVDGLLAAGIQPMLTLYHWDLPAALDERGGWVNPDVAGWFADYAEVLYRRLDGRVKLWATLNEPWVVVDGGYLHGALAPGHRSAFEAPRAAHNLMRAHAAAVGAYRAAGKHQIGLVVNIEPKHAASQTPEDLAATARAEAYMNRQYLDPAMLGTYPEELREIYGEGWPEWPAAEVAALRTKVDFLGLNYYTRSVNRHDPAAWPVRAAQVRQPGATYTDTGWEVHPESFTEALVWMKRRYGDVPIYVTENGVAFYDPPTAPAGGVQDYLRVGYLRDHLRAVHAAIQAGVDVRGYLVWSLLDNLEWASGFKMRFGIVHVDHQTQRRTVKSSGRYYANVVATNGRALADEP
ncbi:MAG: GH1 family beta-glucosidase [Anaeromyxobacteraceae bacterium]